MAQALSAVPEARAEFEEALQRVSRFPRLRYMGSKYRVVPYLVDVFSDLEFSTVLDAFSGSSVVAYALKAMGKQVTANDFLNFSATIARATIENAGVRLEPEDVDRIGGPSLDRRDFIQRTFKGLYFSDEDHAFLDELGRTLRNYRATSTIWRSRQCASLRHEGSRGASSQ